MQFAGQRTDLNLKPIDDPVNKLIKLTPDVVPDVDAVLLTGITPQATLDGGLTERDFLLLFEESVSRPNTIFTGYNNIRFDDEFVRSIHYRNFYDPYEWQWQAGRSRWDLLDVVRMMRALRPEGVKWPFANDGSPTNRLGSMSALNKLDHAHAHDALSDVNATIALAQLVRTHQPKLFNYLLDMRGKKQIAELVLSGEPFVYTSGKYPSEYEKTSVVVALAKHPRRPGALVFDLRFDPTPFKDLSAIEMAAIWRWQKEPVSPRLPVKTLRFNTSPAVAPLGVLDKASEERLQLDIKLIKSHWLKLRKIEADFIPKLLMALDILDDEQQTSLALIEPDIDSKLYDGFFSDKDRLVMQKVRNASAGELTSQNFHFVDRRFSELLPLYKARNFASNLSTTEQIEWENYRNQKLLAGGDNSRLKKYFDRLEVVSQQSHLSDKERYLLEELQLYGQSIMPNEMIDGA